MSIVCPSGLTFNARHWKLGDLASLMESKDDEKSFLPRRMAELAALPGGVVEPGPYPFQAGGDVDFGQVSLSDLTDANIQVRIKTDPEIILTPNCRACGKLQDPPKSIDLRECGRYAASEVGISHLKSGIAVALETDKTSVGKVTVNFKAVRGNDLTILSKIQEKEAAHILEVQSCMSIESILIPGKDSIVGLPAVRRFWREQPWCFRTFVDETIDDLWGGVDCSYRFRCDDITNCRVEQEGVIPLDMNFYGLVPQSRRRKRAKSASLATP